MADQQQQAPSSVDKEEKEPHQQPSSSSPPPPGADRALVFMQKQKFLQQQSDLVEKEIVARMSIIRLHHTHFTSIATKFVSLLERSAKDAFDARDTVLGIGAAGANARARSRSPATSSSQRRHHHVASSSPGGGEDDGYPPGDGFDSPQSNHYYAQGGHQIMDSSSSMVPIASPSRIIMTPKTATGHGIATRVELTGTPQVHRKQVAERRMAIELQKHNELVKKYSDKEHRRSEAHIRREVTLLSKAPLKQAASEAVAVEKSKREADFEIQQRVKREVVREKHERMTDKNQRIKNERQAVQSAVRRLEDMTTKTIDATAKNFRNATTAATHEAIRVHEEQLARQEAADRALRRSMQGRSQAKASFKREYDMEMQSLRTRIKTHENNAHIEHAKQVANAQAVEVAWPEHILDPPKSKQNRRINDLHYARLCGAKESILRGYDGNNKHRDPSASFGLQSEEVRLEDIQSLKHLAPSHWKYLESSQPAMLWEALRTVEAAVVRGPQSVSWKK